MSTITQQEDVKDDPVVSLQAWVKKSVRTHLNLMAVSKGTNIGEVLTGLLREHAGYVEPAEDDTATSENSRPGARPANKQR